MSEPTEKETLVKDIANAEKSRLAAEAAQYEKGLFRPNFYLLVVDCCLIKFVI